MTVAKAPRFKSLEEYLAADPSDLPEGRCEYWDGELVPVMTESLLNDLIAKGLIFPFMSLSIPLALIYCHSCEVAVPGRPRTRFPDFLIAAEAHLELLAKKTTITQEMPPPRLIGEVVSPGDEKSDNYLRDYRDKPQQYAAIGVLEYWLIDPNRDWVKVGTLRSGTYEYQTFQGDEAIISPMFPGLKLTAEKVLNVINSSAR
jgi:Uma2 family endonuclease